MIDMIDLFSACKMVLFYYTCSFDPFSIGSEDSIEKEITRKICENVRY